MSDFPSTNQIICPLLSSEGVWSLGGKMIGHTINASTPSAVWVSANRGYDIPFDLICPFNLRSMFCFYGGTVAGNLDFGVYALDGTLIVSTGAVAQSGTSALQIASITQTLLSPGSYYMAMSASSNSATVSKHSYGAAGLSVAGVLMAASQHPLTTLPTFANTTGQNPPVMGIASITSF